MLEENKLREEMDRERWGLVEQRIWIGDHSTGVGTSQSEWMRVCE